MLRIITKFKKSFIYELPIIQLYALLYLIGVFIGVITAILLRNDFSEQAHLLFSSESAGSFFTAYSQQVIFFSILFLLGLTIVGLPFIPLYPLYKGFSLGLLVSLSVVLSGVRGLIFSTLAFFAQNAYYTILGYFICYSSTRLSVSLFQLLRGKGRHSGAYSEFRIHIICFLVLLVLLVPAALWESKIIPIILNLY